MAFRPDNFNRWLKLCRRAKMFEELPENIRVGCASTTEDLRRAYTLVKNTFIEKGYISQSDSKMRIRKYEALPEMTTFIGKDRDSIVAVQSVVSDSEFGLPSDYVFQEEIDNLRSSDKKLLEATNQSCEMNYRSSGINSELMRCCLAYSTTQNYDGIITAVSPGHVGHFKNLCFEQIGEIKNYSNTVVDQVALVHLDLTTLDQKVDARFSPTNGTSKIEELYQWFTQNPYGKAIPNWIEEVRAFFSNPSIPEDFFQRRGFGRKSFSRRKRKNS